MGIRTDEMVLSFFKACAELPPGKDRLQTVGVDLNGYRKFRQCPDHPFVLLKLEEAFQMGYDNLYSFNENGELVADTDRNWISINGNPVAYYHTDTTEVGDAYTISGYVPALLNGERVNLILVFDNDHPNGYVAGATTDYVDGETDTVAKSLTELQNGDTLDFLCDYYSYDQEYLDSYMLGEQITVSGDLTISNTDVGDGAVRLMYRFTDIYEQSYWTPAITVNK